MQISILTSSGKTINFKADNSDTIEHVNAGITFLMEVVNSDTVVPQDPTGPSTRSKKRKIQDKESDMLIYVVSVKCRAMAFRVKGSDTVQTLKFKILGKEGIPLGEQRLIFAGEELVDDRTLADYDVQKESILHLGCRNGVELLEGDEWNIIFLKTFTGRIIPFEVKGSDKIEILKSRIHDIERIPPHQQRLIYLAVGKQLADGRTLTECKVKQGSTLHLVLNIRA